MIPPPIEFQVLFGCLTLILIAMTGYQIHIWNVNIREKNTRDCMQRYRKIISGELDVGIEPYL
jgi:hypothetical protein